MKQTMAVRLSDEDWKYIEIVSRRRGGTITDYIRKLIQKDKAQREFDREEHERHRRELINRVL